MGKGSVYFKIISAATLLLLAGLYSCSSENYSRLQGKWGASGNLGDSTEMRAWFINYEFSDRSYKMSGYPPISEEGTYEIIEEKADSLLMYFNVTKSSPETKSHKEWVVLKNNSVTIGSLLLNRQ
jgi:hypothetical protein